MGHKYTQMTDNNDDYIHFLMTLKCVAKAASYTSKKNLKELKPNAKLSTALQHYLLWLLNTCAKHLMR
jgi:hypothetical protein